MGHALTETPRRESPSVPAAITQWAAPAPASAHALPLRRPATPGDALGALLLRSVRGADPPRLQNPQVQRTCCASCATGHECESERTVLDDHADPLARTLQRAVLARAATSPVLARDQDPGPPQAPDYQGFSWGWRGSHPFDKPFWNIYPGKEGGEGAEVDPDSDAWKPKPKPPPGKGCPPERWNSFWEYCCVPGKVFDGNQSCVSTDEPFEAPPAPEEDWGDFPLPDEYDAYA